MSSIPIVLYGIYLFLFRKRIFENNRRLALIALLILLEGFFAYLSRELDVVTPIEYLIVVPAASMLLTIIFDSRVGFYGTVIIAFVVAGIRGNDYSIALASLVAGALSVYSVRDMKNRTQLFRSLGFIFAGYAHRHHCARSRAVRTDAGDPRAADVRPGQRHRLAGADLRSPDLPGAGVQGHDRSDADGACALQPSAAPPAGRKGAGHISPQHDHGQPGRSRGGLPSEPTKCWSVSGRTSTMSARS